MDKILVLSGGSWATALLQLFSKNASQVSWWMRDSSMIEHIKSTKKNPKYLQDLVLPVEKIQFYTNIREAIVDNDIIIVAIPSAFIESTLQVTTVADWKNKTVFSAVKGIIPVTGEITAQYFHRAFDLPFDNLGSISGPCHAEEVALNKLSYLTISSTYLPNANKIAGYLKNENLHTNTSVDVIGAEYASVLKNVYAIAVGICEGLGYGDNFLAVLVCNALQEMEFFIKMITSNTPDVKQSTYLGDLLVTAYSSFSRNKYFGSLLGKGYASQEAQTKMNMIAEGFYAVKSIYALAIGKNIHLPILEAVYAIVVLNHSAEGAIIKLTPNLK